jgi:hypothetical protein
MPDMRKRGVNTADGRFHVDLYEDQTGQITDGYGTILVGRASLSEIARRLREFGIATWDLIPDGLG